MNTLLNTRKVKLELVFASPFFERNFKKTQMGDQTSSKTKFKPVQTSSEKAFEPTHLTGLKKVKSA